MAISDLKRNIPESEYRLCLLYILERLGLRTADEIWPFVARLDVMDYLSFGENLAQLQLGGEVGGLPAGTLYLSHKGQKTLSLFENRIPASLRARLDEESKGYLLGLMSRLQASAGYEPLPRPGWSGMNARFSETDVPTLLMKMETCRMGLCDSAVRLFADRLRQLIPLLHELFATIPYEDELCDDAFEKAACGHPLLHCYHEGEYAAAVRVETQDTIYRLQLLLPDRDTASRWAHGADAAGVDLAESLCEILS